MFRTIKNLGVNYVSISERPLDSFFATFFNIDQLQAYNQEFFKAVEVSWNEGTSIIILPTKHQKKTPQGNLLRFFFLDALRIAFQMTPSTLR